VEEDERRRHRATIMPQPTGSHLLLRAFSDELARCGIAGAVTCPGSRSTPLVLALVRDGRFPCVSQIDERGGGFFALGMAKADGRPAVVACTSGTAAANLLPAVIEAHEARVPLIVLTADRPPELRDTGAGQTIDQLKLFGDAVRMFAEVGVDEASPANQRWVRTLACRAVAAASGERPGPVHLNFPLREPLVPSEPLGEEPGGGGRPDGRPWVARMPRASAPRAAAATLAPIVRSAERGVVVLGRCERPAGGADLRAAASAFSAASGWPLLADPLSGARSGAGCVAFYDALLRVPQFAAAARPAAVLRAGDLPTSKPLREWLAGLDAVQVMIDPAGAWQDPAQVCDLSLAEEPAPLLAALAELLSGDGEPGNGTPASVADPAWMQAWRSADERAAAAIAELLGEELSEPRLAAELGRSLPADATLFVASSMPVRDVETFFPARLDPPRLLSNRGANGIDGTIASAYGAAAASKGPVVLLIGDVALAHDAGSLVTARRSGIPLTIVLVDNGGGGIFDFLPVATQTDAFEAHVATPAGIDVASLCAAYGLHHLAVSTLDELRAALDHGISSDGTQLIHVRTERAVNVALHRATWDTVAAALADGDRS
jgi:2-succinyl-5-enolpyruvyl-6-hydroxy-3-cyclohexene-1-carboxylate synthase